VNNAARHVIAALGLEPLPREGGYFRQTSRSASASAIYFLITPQELSTLHRLAQDEVWHFYAGDAVDHVQLDPNTGALRVTRMGADILAGDTPQVLVPGGVWQGARVIARTESPSGGQHAQGWALLGCTVSPPWDERSFELARRDELLRSFPEHAAWIRMLTR
jgi:uncharacterized protein